MQEIEILVALHDTIDVTLEKLSGFTRKGIRHIVDIYYDDPLRDVLGWKADGVPAGRFDACCRIREQNGSCFLTYKVNHFSDTHWLYADEYETEVSDAMAAKQIFKQLGLEELVVIDNTRHVFETDLYEIVVEDVKNLGRFLEVEYIGTDKGRAVLDVRADILTFVAALGLSVGQEGVLGKPEMMLVKQRSRS